MENETMPQQCEQKETIQQINNRLHLGDMTLRDIKYSLESLKESIDSIQERSTQTYNRMFIDNGKKSFQSIIEKQSTHMGLQWFLLGAIIMAAFGSVLTAIIQNALAK